MERDRTRHLRLFALGLIQDALSEFMRYVEPGDPYYVKAVEGLRTFDSKSNDPRGAEELGGLMMAVSTLRVTDFYPPGPGRRGHSAGLKEKAARKHAEWQMRDGLNKLRETYGLRNLP